MTQEPPTQEQLAYMVADFMEMMKVAEEGARGFREYLISQGWSNEVAQLIAANMLAKMLFGTSEQ